MNVKATIKCNCGQRIVAKDVMQTGYYLRLFGPSFVYVKFRCSRCKKLGEQFVKQEDWEDSILKDIPSEINQEDQERFRELGPISIHEEIDFHFGLDDDSGFRELIAEVGGELAAARDAETAENAETV